MSTAKFIALEGSEGVGKSTQLKLVADWLASKGREVVSTREPGGSAAAEAIREIVVDPRFSSLSDRSELLLMFAARADHVDSLITPSLKAGKWVVSDRFTEASYAYQGAGRGLGEETVAWLEDFVLGALRPDLTLVLCLDDTLAQDRVDQRGSRDRIEQSGQAFYQRVQDAYLKRVQANPQRMVLINASGTPEDVFALIKSAISARFSL